MDRQGLYKSCRRNLTEVYPRDGLPTRGSNRSAASIIHHFREDMILASRRIAIIELIDPNQDRQRVGDSLSKRHISKSRPVGRPAIVI
jgi:hypothetical protein